MKSDICCRKCKYPEFDIEQMDRSELCDKHQTDFDIVEKETEQNDRFDCLMHSIWQGHRQA